MTIDEMNQLRLIIREEVRPIIREEVGPIVRKEVKNSEKRIMQSFNALDKKVFHIDQRLTQIEIHLRSPTPVFDPDKPIEKVIVNPIRSRD